MIKKLISLLLVICITLSTSIIVSATNTDVSPPAIPTTGDIWDGTITEPKSIVIKDNLYYYEISKCSELAYIAQVGGDWLNYNYILTDNLILNDTIIEWDENGDCINSQNLKKWIQINNFDGKFDGNGFVISGLYGDGGLFGKIKTNSKINNVILINSYINSSSSFSYYVGGIIDDSGSRSTISNCVFSGYVTANANCVGGILGYGYYLTDLSNCVNYGSVNGKTLTGGVAGTCGDVSNCTNYGIVQGADSTGGIAGDATDIYNCINYGSVYGIDYIGGIAGTLYEVSNCINYADVNGESYISGIGSRDYDTSIMNETEFTECMNFGNITATGDYVGGITSKAYAYILRCSNSGTIIGNNYCGGLAGLATFVSGWTTSAIDDSYNIGNVTGNSYCGGIVGSINNTSISYCYNSGNIVGSSNVGALAVNKQQLMFGPSIVGETYYLKNNTINSQIYGCEDVTADILNITAKTNEELKQVRFSSNVWSYNNNKINNGYPYLKYQDTILRKQLLGDINLDDYVDIDDALLLFQNSLYPEYYPIDYIGKLDFTKDGFVDIDDALLLFQYSLYPDYYPIN